MDYYAPPDGSERALRSRIRRCYIALADLQPAVEYLFDNTDRLNEDYAVENVQKMYEMYRETARSLTEITDLDRVDNELGLQRAQERLLTSPGVADGICRSIEHIHDGAKSVIRNIEYQFDAGHFTPTDEMYQTIRESAILVLGLTTIIMDAIDDGFITDIAVYNETGR